VQYSERSLEMNYSVSEHHIGGHSLQFGPAYTIRIGGLYVRRWGSGGGGGGGR